jgi:LAS superfamily LD-carboxypeptidase LdcB
MKIKKFSIVMVLSFISILLITVGCQFFQNTNAASDGVSPKDPNISSTVEATTTSQVPKDINNDLGTTSTDSKGGNFVPQTENDNNSVAENPGDPQNPFGQSNENSQDNTKVNSGLTYKFAYPADNQWSNQYDRIAKNTGYLERYPQMGNSELISYQGQKVVKDAATAFESMRQQAKKDGIALKIISGFRDIQTQMGIFKRKGNSVAAAEYSAPPGHSQHHTGLALDINSLSPSFRKTKEYRWLKNNAPKFGFMLSYENDESKCDLGPHNEPWHWVYIGKSEAKSLMSDFINRARQCGYDPETAKRF